MKYFVNYPYTAESLKAEFRALCLTMHPDKGGNADEFKAMSAEYYDLLKNVDGTTAREAEEARQRAEEARREREEREREAREYEARERARREREEAEERERIRKAQEVTAAAVRAWAGILERIPEAVTGKKRAYDFADDKSRAAYVAATKRNIKAVINHYFPGLKVSVSISGRIWREEFTISWQDGPSIKELRETCKELAYFVPTSYHSDPYADYGDYRERKESAPWREAYGQALGDVTEIEYTRGLSDEGKQQAETIAAEFFANFDPKSDADSFTANLQELINMAKAMGFYKDTQVTNIFRQMTGNYYGDMFGSCEKITGEVQRHNFRKMLAEHVRVNVTPKAKAPEFVPTYGPTYKAIKKAMGANVFYIETKESRKNAEQEMTIFAAAERLASGEAVNLGKRSTWDGQPVIYGTDRGGYKTQQKRMEKYEAVGIILEGVSYNTYGNIKAVGINAETLEALRREFADIERQRKEWEAKQAGKQTADTAEASDTAETSDKGTDKADKGTTANEPTESTPAAESTATADESEPQTTADVSTTATNGDGLRMEKYSEKATVIRGYNAEQAAELEKMGGKEWRNLKGGKGYIFSTRRHGDELAEWMKQQQGEGTTAPAADEPTATTLESGQDITDTTATASASEADTFFDEQSGKAERESNGEISALFEAVADFFGTLARISQEAARFEGVTIPAATLARWKADTEQGTRHMAEKFAEVCACLASLTPDSRKDFDALGAIFWSLSEQIRNGCNPDTLQGATDYARAQLFDLIDRTQNENQARAVREANEADPTQRKAA